MIDREMFLNRWRTGLVPIADFLVCIVNEDDGGLLVFPGIDSDVVVPLFYNVSAAESFFAAIHENLKECDHEPDRYKIVPFPTVDFIESVVHPFKTAGLTGTYKYPTDTDRYFPDANLAIRYSINPESMEHPEGLGHFQSLGAAELLITMLNNTHRNGVDGIKRVDPSDFDDT